MKRENESRTGQKRGKGIDKEVRKGNEWEMLRISWGSG